MSNAAYFAGAAILTHTANQEELDRAKAGLSSLVFLYEGQPLPLWAGPVPRERGEPCWPAGYDPRGESQSVREEGRERFVVTKRAAVVLEPVPLAEVLRLWCIEESGRLSHPLRHVGTDPNAEPEAEIATLAWSYVADTPGWSTYANEAMKHRILRGKGWTEWPRFDHQISSEVESVVSMTLPAKKGGKMEVQTAKTIVTQTRGEYRCSLQKAQAAFDGFMDALAERCEKDPFRIEKRSVEWA